MVARRAHVVTIVIGGAEVGGWTDYQIESSMLAPADAFTLTRKVDRAAWNLCELDALVQVQIDGTPILTGYVEDRDADARARTMTIAGRCKGGRLVSESAPAIQYGGLKLVELVRRLAAPWFTAISLSDARNRAVRRGKGHKVPAPTEPLFLCRTLMTSRKVSMPTMRPPARRVARMTAPNAARTPPAARSAARSSG